LLLLPLSDCHVTVSYFVAKGFRAASPKMESEIAEIKKQVAALQKELSRVAGW
jgi:hypothetical protein